MGAIISGWGLVRLWEDPDPGSEWISGHRQHCLPDDGAPRAGDEEATKNGSVSSPFWSPRRSNPVPIESRQLEVTRRKRGERNHDQGPAWFIANG